MRLFTFNRMVRKIKKARKCYYEYQKLMEEVIREIVRKFKVMPSESVTFIILKEDRKNTIEKFGAEPILDIMLDKEEPNKTFFLLILENGKVVLKEVTIKPFKREYKLIGELN